MTDTGKSPELSILIVGYNAADWLERCLASVAGPGQPSCSYEVILVDNASAPPLVEVLDMGKRGVRVVTLSENVGFGNAVNLARSLANGRLLLLLNPDAEATPGAIDHLVAFHDADPSRGIVGGRTDSPDGRIDDRNAFDQPTLWSQVCFAAGLSTALPRSSRFNPEAIPAWGRDTERQVGVVTGCALLLSARLLDEVGGFDPAFFMYGEDVDLCRRVIDTGHRPAVDPHAVFVHAFGASSTSDGKRKLVLRGKATLYRKYGTRWTRPVSRVLLLTGVALRSIVEQITRSTDRGWTAAWRSRREWITGWTAPPVPVVVTADSGSPSSA